MFLPLAERMTKKYADENKIDAEAGKNLDFRCNLDVIGITV